MESTAAAPHDHVYLDPDHDRMGRRTLAVVALTFVTMLAEITAGLLTGSMALLADGLHMATHAGALGLAAAAYAFARARAHDPSFSFGTGKVGDLAGFASALILAMVALGVAAESIGRLWSPPGVAYREAAVVAVLGLVVNLASAVILGACHHHGHGHGHDHGGHGHDHRHDHDGHDHDHAHDHGHTHDHHHHAAKQGGPGGDTNYRAAMAHVLTDALTSVLAILALAAGGVWGAAWVDPAVGLLGAAVILAWAVRLMRESSRVLLDRADPGLCRAVRDAAGGEALDLHVWRIGPQAHAAVVSLKGPADAQAARARIGRVPGIAHVTVEVLD